MTRFFSSVAFLVLLLSASTVRAQCERVRGEARPVCERIVQAIRSDDAAALLAELPPTGTTLIDRERPPGARTVRLRTHEQARAAIGTSLRAFLRIDPATAEIRVVHHVHEPHSDVLAFLRIEVRSGDAYASIAGGPGFRPNLIILRRRA